MALAKRKLCAVLTADVAGGSRLIGIDEAGTLSRLLGIHRRRYLDDEDAANIFVSNPDGRRSCHQST